MGHGTGNFSIYSDYRCNSLSLPFGFVMVTIGVEKIKNPTAMVHLPYVLPVSNLNIPHKKAIGQIDARGYGPIWKGVTILTH